MTTIDGIIFCCYFIGVVVFATTVAARSKTKSSSDYFLASRKLPWYVVGASFIASNISTEHFIGMVGWGFLYGMAVASWEWGNVLTFTILIWVFLPFYMRGNVSTMPEFLERRFNKFCRYIYALVMIVGLVIALLGGVLFAGAKALNVFFPQIPMMWAIILLALASGIYTVYGGLISAVWADLLQYVLLMTGGIVVTVFGIYHAGGIGELVAELPERFIVFHPPTHEMIPWTGLILGLLAVGVWYNCANQFMIQRCLGARSEWDARMGIVMAGFSKAILPFIVVVPGIVAFHLFQDQISDGDQSWPFLVQRFLPNGMIGLVLAGLASAILSTLSAITNSSATIFTLDLYRSLVRPGASDRELHTVGRLSAAVVMIIGIVVALVVASAKGVTVFGLIQQVFFYVAPPISAAFLVGILWPRTTSVAATTTLILGFVVYLPIVVFWIFPKVPLLAPYNNFMHHTFAVFLLSILTLFVVSLVTKPKSRGELEGVIWTRSALRIGKSEKGGNRGTRSLLLGWILMVVTIVSLYAYTHLRAGDTRLVEAEDLEYAVSGLGSVRIQARRELDNFNLWTGRGQVLFKSASEADSLNFRLPISRSGRYRVGVVVTRGPSYGRFQVAVNRHKAELIVPETVLTAEGDFEVVRRRTSVFDASRKVNVGGQRQGIAGSHLVKRICLGDFDLLPGINQITFQPVGFSENGSQIGVDQFIVTPLGR